MTVEINVLVLLLLLGLFLYIGFMASSVLAASGRCADYERGYRDGKNHDQIVKAYLENVR